MAIRTISVFLLLIIIVSFCSFGYCSSTISSYDALVNMGDSFITKIHKGGATDSEIKTFFDDLDDQVDQFQQEIAPDQLETFFVQLLIYVIQFEHNANFFAAFDLSFQDEITYISENKKVPESFKIMMYVVMGRKVLVQVPPPVVPDTNEPTDPPVDDNNDKPDKPVEVKLYFTDVNPNDWFFKEVTELYENKIINGMTETTFEPNTVITREQFIKMLIVSLISPKEKVPDDIFVEADQNAWYYNYVNLAHYLGITSGIFDGYFEKDKPITRQEMVALAYRAAKRSDIVLKKVVHVTDFEDISMIKYYALDAIKELQQAGIVKGVENNRFAPDETSTRAQASRIIYGLYKLKTP